MPELTPLTPMELAEELNLASGRLQGFSEALAIFERAGPTPSAEALHQLALDLEEALGRFKAEAADLKAKAASLPSTAQH